MKQTLGQLEIASLYLGGHDFGGLVAEVDPPRLVVRLFRSGVAQAAARSLNRNGLKSVLTS
jgi:hypothetical protein